MKAAVCRAFGEPLTIEEINLAPPKSDQIEVQIKACAVCHSDIFYAEGEWGGNLPAVYGHEAAGIVKTVGSNVTEFAVGDHVCVTLIRSCGICPTCAGGTPSDCDQPWDKSVTPLSDKNGKQIVKAMNSGAFAERIVVHPSQCAHIPKDMAFDAASLLSCGVITGVGAVVNTAQVRPGAKVAVIGTGGVGLNAIQGARICGASIIIGMDLTTEKLQAAKEFGATHGVLASDKNACEKVKALTNGRGVDYAFVTVGAPVAFQNAPALLAKGGAMVIVGMPPVDAVVGYKPMELADASQRFLGSSMGQTVVKRDIPWLLELYAQGRLQLDELVSNRYSLDQINEAFAHTQSGKARRNVIVFD